MKNKTIKLFSGQILLWMMFLAFFVGCGDDGGGTAPPYDPNKPVKLESFMPTSGKITTPVILRGENFGNDASKVKVYFNNNEAFVATAADTRLFVITPKCTYEDNCKISVVIENDSVTYTQEYEYNTTFNVSTLVGGTTGDNEDFEESTMAQAQFVDDCNGLTIDHEDNLYLVTSLRIYRISERENHVKKILGYDNTPFLTWHTNICTDANKKWIFTAASMHPKNIIRFDPDNDFQYVNRDVVEGADVPDNLKINGLYKYDMAASPVDGKIYSKVVTENKVLFRFDPNTFAAETVLNGSVFPFTDGDVWGMEFHPKHPNLLYMTNESWHSIWALDLDKLDEPSNRFKLIAGPGRKVSGYYDGDASEALFNKPRGITFDTNGDLYIVDCDNQCIRKLDYETNMVSTVAGIPGVAGYSDGDADYALFHNPYDIAINSEGVIYVSEAGNRSVRRLAIE